MVSVVENTLWVAGARPIPVPRRATLLVACLPSGPVTRYLSLIRKHALCSGCSQAQPGRREIPPAFASFAAALRSVAHRTHHQPPKVSNAPRASKRRARGMLETWTVGNVLGLRTVPQREFERASARPSARFCHPEVTFPGEFANIGLPCLAFPSVYPPRSLPAPSKAKGRATVGSPRLRSPGDRHGCRRYKQAAFCFVRVPKTCPRPAFLAVLALVAQSRVSNLQIRRRGSKSKSHPGHQSINSHRTPRFSVDIVLDSRVDSQQERPGFICVCVVDPVR